MIFNMPPVSVTSLSALWPLSLSFWRAVWGEADDFPVRYSICTATEGHYLKWAIIASVLRSRRKACNFTLQISIWTAAVEELEVSNSSFRELEPGATVFWNKRLLFGSLDQSLRKHVRLDILIVNTCMFPI